MGILIHIITIPITFFLEVVSWVSPRFAYRLAHNSILSVSIDRQLGHRLF